MEERYLGLDLGTSSARAALFAPDGRMTDLFSREISLKTGPDGRAVLDPAVLVETVRGLLDEALAHGPVSGGGLSVFMHSLLALDEAGRPLTGAMTFLDRRGAEQAEALSGHPQLAELYRHTGCRITSPIYPVAKLLSLREREPELFARAASFVTVKEYLCRELFGEDLIDVADASATGLYDTLSGGWNAAMLALLGIREEQLGTVAPGETRVFWKGVPLCLGLTDGVLAHRGCGARPERDLSCTVGTSGALRLQTARPPEDPERKLWAYRMDRSFFVAGGAITGGGVGLRWLRDTFGNELRAQAGCENLYAAMDLLVERAPAGCAGLTVLPTPGPERSPDWNSATTGSLWGLELHHGLAHLARGVMEGVLYRLYDIFQCLPPLPEGRILATGGYARSALWLQMQADLFGREIAVPPVTEATALGAASLFCPELLPKQPERVYTPDPRQREAYREGYRRYRELYRRLYGQ